MKSKYIVMSLSFMVVVSFSALSNWVYAANNVEDIKNMRGIRTVEKDPTKPIFSNAKKKENVIFLHGIMKKNGKYIAIINGQKRHEGESINGAKILKIEKNKVQVRHDGEIKNILLRSKVGR